MKTFYIDHVERKGDTTILKCYAVVAETFEEAIALHDTDWENFHGKAVFPPEIAHCAENLVEGWSLRQVEEEREFARFEMYMTLFLLDLGIEVIE